MKLKGLILLLAAILFTDAAQAQVNYGITNGTAYVSNSPSASGSIVISNVYNGYPVTSIGSSAFYNCQNLTNVTFGANVTSIGSSAFQNCFNLTNVAMNAGLLTIGTSAFLNCQTLPSVVIPDT